MNFVNDSAVNIDYSVDWKGVPQLQDSITTNYGSTTVFIKGCLVLLLRFGFVLIQLGSIPTENIYVILVHNIIDISLSLICFGLLGFIFAYGEDIFKGFIGFYLLADAESSNLDDAIIGFCTCLISNGIITTALAGRVHFFGYSILTILHSTFLLPLLIHVCWHHEGWMQDQIFGDYRVSLKDHAGSLVIHFSSGLVSLIGLSVLGRRLIRLVDLDVSSIGAESTGTTIVGYTFVLVGLMSFSLPSQMYEFTHMPANYIGRIVVNQFMAIGAGVFVVVMLQFISYQATFNYWIILRCLQGSIAGLVSLSASVDLYSPTRAFALASLGAAFFFVIANCVNKSSIEDYCNIIAIHLVCGVLATLAPPFLANAENLGVSVSLYARTVHFLWQLICLCIVLGFFVLIYLIIVVFLNRCGILRNVKERINHKRALNAARKGPERCCLERLFKIHSNTQFIEPGVHTNVDDSGSYLSIIDGSSRNIAQREKTARPNVVTVNRAEFVNSGAFKQDKKSRNVFTVLNAPRNDYSHQHINQTESLRLPQCSPEARNSNPSKYDLHRTKKLFNLARDIRRIKKFTFKEKAVELPIRDFKCFSYDRQFNDGFISLKIPPVSETNLSDSSEASIEV